MKKNYIKPEMEIVELPKQTPLLAGSPYQLYNDPADTIDDEGEVF